MRNIILFTSFLLGACAVFINWQKPGSDDELAYKMSRSENFKAVLEFWKTNGGIMTSMPDSNKVKLYALRDRMVSLIQNGNSLTQSQVRDSMNIIVNLIKRDSLIDSSFLKRSATAIPMYKGLNKEFPEYKTLSPQRRSKIFRKAVALLRKRND